MILATVWPIGHRPSSEGTFASTRPTGILFTRWIEAQNPAAVRRTRKEPALLLALGHAWDICHGDRYAHDAVAAGAARLGPARSAGPVAGPAAARMPESAQQARHREVAGARQLPGDNDPAVGLERDRVAGRVGAEVNDRLPGGAERGVRRSVGVEACSHS
jgi:hypothetical protein